MNTWHGSGAFAVNENASHCTRVLTKQVARTILLFIYTAIHQEDVR